jgi:diguanylate cyclase (GGDEF)-like protein
VSDAIAALVVGTFAEQARITISFFDENFAWGADQGDAGSHKALSEDIGEGTVATLYCKAWPTTVKERLCLENFGRLSRALWGEELRGRGGIELNRERVQKQLPKSVSRLTAHGESDRVVVVFADLDKFGTLNKQAGQDVGDKAIHFVNAKLHECCRKLGGLAFHQSGDEFCLVLPDTGSLSALTGLRALRREIKARAFKSHDGRDLHVDLTLGVCWVMASSDLAGIRDGIATADRTTRRRTDTGEVEKRRGKVCFQLQPRASGVTCLPSSLGRLGAILVRRRVLHEAFGDTRLNLIAGAVAETVVASEGRVDREAVGQEVSDLLDWLDVKLDDTCTTASLLGSDPPEEINEVCIALAIAQGILRAACSTVAVCSVDLAIDDECANAAVSEGARLVWGRPTENSVFIRVGERSLEPQRARCLIGVQYGIGQDLLLDALPIPSHLFDKLVLVDERPKKGGGLPDFWQVAVAEVCQIAAAFAAEPYVLFWGAGASETETFHRLTGKTQWSTDEFVTLTDISSENVVQLKDSLARNTTVHVDAESVIQRLLDVARDPAHVGIPRFSDDGQEARLQRGLLARDELSAEDGLRCSTASEAYPLVLDVLRKGTKRRSVDDANHSLSELLAFRVVLDSPNQATVPAYYRPQEGDMEQYAENVLLREDGQISSLLWKSGQVDAVIDHLASYYQDALSERCTRRACLVVPHEIVHGNVQPLGLVAVWATPRAARVDRDHVDFVFVWRTVEAFVGFPFSLFGSIKLAQKLTDLVSSRLLCEQNSPRLRVGKLVYVALRTR